jgi:hypothetical protein
VPSGVAFDAGPVGRRDRRDARSTEAPEGACMPLAIVTAKRAPKITKMLGVIVVLP